MKKYSATLVMVALAVVCLGMHYYFGWQVFVEEAKEHGETAYMSDYIAEWFRDVFENLQSEFWQLAAQFFLLAGGLKMWKVHAYEEDLEQVKSSLSRIERGIAKEANP